VTIVARLQQPTITAVEHAWQLDPSCEMEGVQAGPLAETFVESELGLSMLHQRHTLLRTSVDIKRHSLKSLSIGIRFLLRLRKAASEPKMNSDADHRSFRLKSLNGKSLAVVLSPADPDDECPLSLGPICEDNLDFLNGSTFIPNLPQFKRMTLPCGHSFGAMNVMYHFARQNMLCPCCRAGVNDSMQVDSIPAHFRNEMAQCVQVATSEKSEANDSCVDCIASEQSVEISRQAVDLISSRFLVLGL
jgi:hypothetical protein